MKKLKRMIMPLTMGCVMVVGATSVFASNVVGSDNDLSSIITPFDFTYDVEQNIYQMSDTTGTKFTPTYKYGKIWFRNDSSKTARVNITKDGKEFTSFTVDANSSEYKYCNFSPGDSYSYSIIAIDGSVVPVGKIAIKTGETEKDVK